VPPWNQRSPNPHLQQEEFENNGIDEAGGHTERMVQSQEPEEGQITKEQLSNVQAMP
jgi:hypothetical protein